jgi:hypothetical protein
MNPTARPAAAATGLIALALVLSGCTKSDRKPVFPAGGTLTIAGKPAVGVFVVYIPVKAEDDTPPRATALTQADGSYKLTTYETGDGAPAGDFKITLLYERLSSPFLKKSEPAPKIDTKYLKPNSTPLRAAVGRDPVRNTINLELP